LSFCTSSFSESKMMQAALRATMTRIGFTAAGSQAIVEDQDISTSAEVQLLTDDEIESLCKVLCCPGGMVPGAVPGAAQVQNPGVQVSVRAEGHMKLMVLYLRHQAPVSRSVTPADITLDSISTVRELREFESSYKVPTDNLPTINAKDWPKTMETIDEYLRSYLGERNIPLVYVVLKTEAIPAGPDPPTNYRSIQDEMITRAPHTQVGADGTVGPDPIYLANREKVWDIISKITRDHPAWDNCLEREASMRLFTAHDIYNLNGQVPETVVSGETADCRVQMVRVGNLPRYVRDIPGCTDGTW
jgi:ribosomal protein S13